MVPACVRESESLAWDHANCDGVHAASVGRIGASFIPASWFSDTREKEHSILHTLHTCITLLCLNALAPTNVLLFVSSK